MKHIVLDGTEIFVTVVAITFLLVTIRIASCATLRGLMRGLMRGLTNFPETPHR